MPVYAAFGFFTPGSRVCSGFHPVHPESCPGNSQSTRLELAELSDLSLGHHRRDRNSDRRSSRTGLERLVRRYRRTAFDRSDFSGCEPVFLFLFSSVYRANLIFSSNFFNCVFREHPLLHFSDGGSLVPTNQPDRLSLRGSDFNCGFHR